jgi:outer membrane protein TolC
MASDVLNGKIYSYQRGETSLLEVLNAQRTFNEIQSAYYEALFNRAAALVNLEKSAGIWDINL